MNRRQLLQMAFSGVIAAIAIPQTVFAFARSGFEAKEENKALKQAFGTSKLNISDKVTLSAPDIAENGSVVPVTVSTTLKNIEAIAIFVEKNPTPLAASFNFYKSMKPEISTRIKMRKTSKVTAVVKSNGKLYSVSKEVKVTLGGCGG
jgi:sulfur-oxidizing protein SoxY